MTREILSFTAGLGHAEVIYRCDNEPTMRQLLKYVVSTRLSKGLPTRSATHPAYCRLAQSLRRARLSKAALDGTIGFEKITFQCAGLTSLNIQYHQLLARRTLQ